MVRLRSTTRPGARRDGAWTPASPLERRHRKVAAAPGGRRAQGWAARSERNAPMKVPRRALWQHRRHGRRWWPVVRGCGAPQRSHRPEVGSFGSGGCTHSPIRPRTHRPHLNAPTSPERTHLDALPPARGEPAAGRHDRGRRARLDRGAGAPRPQPGPGGTGPATRRRLCLRAPPSPPGPTPNTRHIPRRTTKTPESALRASAIGPPS